MLDKNPISVVLSDEGLNTTPPPMVIALMSGLYDAVQSKCHYAP